MADFAGTLTADRLTLVHGETLTLTYAVDTAHLSDANWVGIYIAGDEPVDGASVGPSATWQYAPGATGSVTFADDLPNGGDLVACYLYNDGYETLAANVAFTVTPGEPTDPIGTLEADRSTLDEGETIVFTYTVPEEQVSDLNWVGIYVEGTEPIDGQPQVGSLIWQYTPGASGTASFSGGIPGGGNYVACYMYDDGYDFLAEPVKFTVNAVPQTPPPTFAGAFGHTGTRPGSLRRPTGLTIDAEGHLWVADTGNDRIQVFTRAGRLLRTMGARVLSEPQAVAVGANGHVFVADLGNHRAVELTARGRLVREFGAQELDNPRGVALTPRQTLLVSDTRNQRVVEYALSNGAKVGELTESMSGPCGIGIDPDGNTWVVQSGHHDSFLNGLMRYAADGTVTKILGGGQYSRYGGLSNPAYLAFDDVGQVVVTVPDYGWASTFRLSGPFLNEFGTGGRALMRFPLGIAIATDGTIFVVDSGNDRIVRFEPAS